MEMTFEQALKIIGEANLMVEGKGPKSAKDWKAIVDHWAAKVEEQKKLLADNPQWIGRPAELSTKKLIAKYNGYYKKAVEEWQNCEDYEERMREEQRQADLEWEQQCELETMRNYDFDRGDWRY